MTKLYARIDRKTGDVILMTGEAKIPFGRLSNCEACHVFTSDNDELVEYISHRIEGDMSLKEMLHEVRQGYEAYLSEIEAMYKHEMYCENAWLRHAEHFDPEAQRDLELHDYLHPHGYY